MSMISECITLHKFLVFLLNFGNKNFIIKRSSKNYTNYVICPFTTLKVDMMRVLI